MLLQCDRVVMCEFAMFLCCCDVFVLLQCVSLRCFCVVAVCEFVRFLCCCDVFVLLQCVSL